MALYYLDNFDTDTAAARPAWWNGGTSQVGTWLVEGSGPFFTSPNVFQTTTHADGDIAVLKGGSGVSIPTVADFTVTFVVKQGTEEALYPILRHNGAAAASANFYTFLLGDAAGTYHVQLYKSISGTLSTVGSNNDTGIAVLTSGQFLHVKANCTGTTIQFKCWKDGNAEPGSYQSIITDSSVSAAGYPGIYAHNPPVANGVDNYEVDSTSSLTLGSPTFSAIGGTTVTASVTAASGGSGSGYTYQWYLATVTGFIPQTSNLISGATSASSNITGLTVSTTYYGRCLVTDGAGSICWSTENSFTTTSGSATDFSISPPAATNLVPGQTSGNIGLTANGTPSSAVTYTFADTYTVGGGAAGGTFTPSTITGVNDSATHNFTYTLAAGATQGAGITLTVTASGGLTNVHTQALTVLTVATDFSLSPNPASTTTGVATGNITVALNNSVPHAGVSVALNLSGTPGGSCTPSSLSFSEGGATSATFTYTPVSAGVETISVVASGGLSATHNETVNVSSSALTAGTLTFVSAVAGAINMTCTAATGGSGVYTQQLLRGSYTGFSTNVTPTTNHVATGQTGATLKDQTVKLGTKYYYVMRYTDSFGAVVYSNEVNGTVPNLVIGFIGDSITNGFQTTGPTGVIGNATAAPLGGTVGNCKTFLAALTGAGGITTSNQGVNGTATSDWTSTGGGSNYETAKAAFVSASLGSTNGVIVVTLGTNDSNTAFNHTAAQVLANLQTIILNIKADFPGVPIIINEPPWYDGTRAGGNFSSTTFALMKTYFPSIEGLPDNKTVFLGDTGGIAVFNATNEGSTSANGFLADGLHPNDSGAVVLGFLWALAIMRVLYPSIPGPTAAVGGN